jgi:RNA polymerase sigma-70 factor (ECF subfamily)
MTTITNSKDAIRRAADGLEAVSTFGFARRDPRVTSDAGEELIRRAANRARSGDKDALRFLYLRFSGAVYSYVSSILADSHAAEDITQTVFSRLAIRLQRYQPTEAPFGTWIARVAHNAAIDYMRGQRMVPTEEVLDPAASREDVSKERLDALCRALKRLPDDQREVMVLRFVVGMSAGEIGERLGRSEPAVHALQHKGRRRLRSELERLDAAPIVRAAA